MGTVSLVYYQWQDWFPWFWRYFIFEFKYKIIGIPFILPFLYASLVFWWRGSVTVWVISTMILLPRLLFYFSYFESVLRNIAFLFVPLTIVIIITLEIRWRERQRQILEEREKERQIYMSEIFKAEEKERLRIAQELHDGSIQELLVIANRAQDLASNNQNKSNRQIIEHAESIRDSILQVLDDIRNLSLDLRPSILDNVGLIPALRWLAERLNRESAINTKIVVKGSERKYQSEIEINIFRIVQEALNNVRRHSGATEALVTLDFTPQYLRITIWDNGIGFASKQRLRKLASEGKLGIIGIQQRAKFINSSFNIESKSGNGTLISIEMAE